VPGLSARLVTSGIPNPHAPASQVVAKRSNRMTRTVLITGASSGIGEASARLFASEGWNVVATMRDPDKAVELRTLRGVLVTRLNVLDRDSIDRAIGASVAAFGRIDALVNNAG
jgi:NADP-dependent 3-hydroxy acid dehydrogenase YdfG